MPEQRLTRADLPETFTVETVRGLPLGSLRRLARPGNGILAPEEQASFDAVLHEVMSSTADRVSRQLSRSDWAAMRRDASSRSGRRGGPGRPNRVDQHLQRLAEGIDEQVDVAEALAPAVDWSFAQPDGRPADVSLPAEPAPTATDGGETETVSDLEQRLTEQVELVQVMSEIADVSKRTYELEQERDLQNTRTVFFGFVVSVAVLVAGWAPLVAADDWVERAWVVGLTLGTCAVAAAVYALIRKRQDRRRSEA